MIGNFADSFFKDEIREGFLVEEEMKHAWAAELEVLAQINRICSAHGIPYFADSGTLLGAVRHRGFIPWDDDMDICMLRKDYLKFLSIASKELPSSMKLFHIDSNDYWDEAFTRVVNDTKVDFTKEHLEEWHGCPWIVGVDIFPLDVLPDNEEEKNALLALTDALRLMKRNLPALEAAGGGKVPEEEILGIEQVYGIKIDRQGNLGRQLAWARDKLAMSYLEESGRQIACLLYNVENKVFEGEWFEKPQYLPFENIGIPVPGNYDAVLRVVYGDYRIPVRDGSMHEYPFYSGQKKMWMESQSGKNKEDGNDKA